MYILCLIWLWTRSLKTEVEKLRMERLEVLLNVFIRFCKFGKVRKTEETLADFPEKHLSVGKEKKKKFF